MPQFYDTNCCQPTEEESTHPPGEGAKASQHHFQIIQRPVITHSKDAAPEDTSDHLLSTRIQTPETHLFSNYYILAFEQVMFILRSKVK